MTNSVLRCLLTYYSLAEKAGKKYNLNPTYWTVSGGILSVLVAFKLMGLPSTKEILPNETIRLYILMILVSTIVMSYALGKAKAVKIYTNKEIKYITAKTDNTSIEIQPISDTTRLKLLGFLGSKVIVSSLDNKKIHILPQSSVDVLTIEKVEEKLPEKQKK